MFQQLGLTPRRTFIAACFIMVGVDQNIDERELLKFEEILSRYGFTQKEAEEEIVRFSKMSFKQGYRYGQKIMLAVQKLDKDMQNNLLKALKEIAEADDYFHDMEKDYLKAVEFAVNIS